MTQYPLIPLPPGAPSADRAGLARAVEQINRAVSATDSAHDLVTVTLPRRQMETIAALATAGAPTPEAT